MTIICNRHPRRYILRQQKSKHASDRVRVLFFTHKLAFIASICLLGLNFGSVVAETRSLADPLLITQEETSQSQQLFVNPRIGNDHRGNGSENAPLQTITQALRLAQSNTVIILAPGTYSITTGESFPLILKPGITVQGNTNQQGRGTNIQGGGSYLSRRFGRQNVAIVGAEQATLSGVRVTNSNPRGYGLWIESTSPTVIKNSFIGNTQDGMAVTGDAAPIITENSFSRNRGNGITISGNAQPQITENIFDLTGIGINITENALPVLVGNQVQNNRSGIIVQGNARPILRNNIIQNHQEYGLIAIGEAVPNLGTLAEPGGNQFRNNILHDINNSTIRGVIPAFGNNFSPNHIVGRVDFQAQSYTSPDPTMDENVSSKIPTNVNIDSNIVEFAAPEPSSLPINQSHPFSIPEDAPFGESVLLPDTNAKLPPHLIIPTPEEDSLRYRVVVNIDNDGQINIVKNLVPEAFPTLYKGRRVMQVGVFNTRENANQIENILNRNGLKTIIEPLD